MKYLIQHVNPSTGILVSKNLVQELVLGVFVLFLLISPIYAQQNYTAQRERMVLVQLKSRDIFHNPTLEAMGKVPRHEFVPENIKAYAYIDNALSIGHGQTISQPYIVAFMTQAIRPKKDYKVLEIGTGSGYQAAVLAEIVNSVYTIEIVDTLAREAEKRLRRLQYQNIEVRSGDGYHGWPEEAPFDAIVVTAGAEEIPMALFDQLKEGGKMVMPLGPHGGIRQLVRITKKRGEIKIQELMAVRFVPFTRKQEE